MGSIWVSNISIEGGIGVAIRETGPNGGLTVVWAIGTGFFFLSSFMLLTNVLLLLYLDLIYVLKTGRAAVTKRAQTTHLASFGS